MTHHAILMATACAVGLLATSPARSHATFEVGSATQNSGYKAVLRVPHGCAGTATHTVRITIPEGIIAVKPMPKPSWVLKTTKGDYARGYALYGAEVKSGVKEISWSGGHLPDDQYDEFVFQARMSDALPAGESVFIPVVQECAAAQMAWVEIPAKGQDPHDLKSPAPGIKILAQAARPAAHGQAAPAVKDVKAGSLIIAAPWSRATPAGAKVAGGYLTITNTGTETDRLIGGSSDIAGALEVHEMRMDGSVMTMRALEKGLEIKPGARVELKPGGYHLMLLDLKKPLVAGMRVKGILVFEKAGTVAIEYTIEALGASNAAQGEHKH